MSHKKVFISTLLGVFLASSSSVLMATAMDDFLNSQDNDAPVILMIAPHKLDGHLDILDQIKGIGDVTIGGRRASELTEDQVRDSLKKDTIYFRVFVRDLKQHPEIFPYLTLTAQQSAAWQMEQDMKKEDELSQNGK